MKRSVILGVTALAIVVAACSTAASPSPSPATPAPSPSPALGDIVATADGAGTFKTLLAAATAAGDVGDRVLGDRQRGDGCRGDRVRHRALPRWCPGCRGQGPPAGTSCRSWASAGKQIRRIT